MANFSIAGKDQVFYPSEAVIKDDMVIVRSHAISEPVAVRYAWADSPAGCNFYNLAGFLASPFRTDDYICWSANGERPNIGPVKLSEYYGYTELT